MIPFNNNIYPNLYILKTLGDGSCLIHSLLLAYDEEYIMAKTQERSQKARDFRDNLSKLISYDYPKLGRKNYLKISQDFPEYSLNSMIKILEGNDSLDYTFFEFICNKINKDLYIIDDRTKEIYITLEEDLYQKGRETIVILFNGFHYDLIGLYDPENQELTTVFDPNHKFIKTLNKKIYRKI